MDQLILKLLNERQFLGCKITNLTRCKWLLCVINFNVVRYYAASGWNIDSCRHRRKSQRMDEMKLKLPRKYSKKERKKNVQRQEEKFLFLPTAASVAAAKVANKRD